MAAPADLTAIARAEHAAFGGELTVTRYWNDDESVWVDILECVDRPDPGVTSWGTIGMSRFDSDTETDDGTLIAVELVAEVLSPYRSFGTMLTSCALNISDGEFAASADLVYPDIVRQYEPDLPMAHMLLTDIVSPWVLPPVERDGDVLVFLQAVPVSDAEMRFARSHGVEALKDRMEQAQVDIRDLRRDSVV